MADMATVFGIVPPLIFEKREWTFSERTFEHEALFETWLKRQALHNVQRLKDDMSLAEYQSQMDGWRRECAAQLYTYDGLLSIQAQFSVPGQKYLVYLALKERHPDVDMHLVDRLYKTEGKWDEVLGIMAALNDPNRRRPAQGQTPAQGQPGTEKPAS